MSLWVFFFLKWDNAFSILCLYDLDIFEQPRPISVCLMFYALYGRNIIKGMSPHDIRKQMDFVPILAC